MTTPSEAGPERLTRLTPDRLDDEQRALRSAILGGPRGSGPQAFPLAADDGALHGPFGVMLHAPAVGGPLQELGAALRYRTSLTTRTREIAVLQVAVATGSAFEWWAHERLGRAAGLTEQELTLLAMGAPLSLPDPSEQAVHDFVAAVLHGPVVDPASYRSAETVLGEAVLVELAVLVGYYRLLADTMHVFAVRPPAESATGKDAAARLTVDSMCDPGG